MKAKKVIGVECPNCGEFNDKKTLLEQVELVYDITDLNDTALVPASTIEDMETVGAYRFDCCDSYVLEYEVEWGDFFRCGECESVYEDKEEAKGCCKE